MVDKKFWSNVSNGMAGNSTALLALACLIIGCVLLFAKHEIWVAIGFPLTILVIYCAYKLNMKKQEVRIEETKTERAFGGALTRLQKPGKRK